MDFAALPPEVNSGRMYAGAGSVPMMAAAAAWDQLAAQLSSAAGSYQTVIGELTDGPWRGPASASMAAAAEPYLEWMHTTAARAEQTANQARAAATAYEQAFAATVPPSVVAANRAASTSLTTTNIFGQNSAAIAANQAEYAEMWAQDVAAMHGYAASSAAATTLAPFTAPPQNTDPAGTSAQPGAAASNTAASAPTVLANAAQSNPLLDLLDSDPIQALETFYAGTTGFWQLFGSTTTQTAGWEFSVGMGAESAIFGTQAFAGATGLVPALSSLASSSVSEGASQFTLADSYRPEVGASGSPGAVDAAVSAGLGRAAPVGGLSVPPSWGARSAGIRLAATAAPTSGNPGLAALPATQVMAAPGGWLGGVPPVASVVNTAATSRSAARPGSEFTVIPRLARAPAAAETAQYRRAAHPSAPYAANASAEHEKDELEELRKMVAELTERREAATHLVREAIEI